MFRLTRHHLLLLISLLPSLMAAADSSGSTGISTHNLRALQEEEEADHDHDGDGEQDHTEEEHNDLMTTEEEDEDHDHDGEEDHDDHDHQDKVEFEWAGVFHLAPGTSYVLTLKPPAHDDDDDHDEDDHSGHDHFRLLQEAEEDHDHDGDGEQDHTEEEHNEMMMEGEDDHDHDGDGVADHAAEDHSVLLEEEYHFFLAIVPVAEHGQEGIDEATAALMPNMDVIKEVANGETIEPSASQVYELYFPAEEHLDEEMPAMDANATDIPAVTARAGHTAATNGVMTLIISVPASETKQDFVIMLPGKPAEVAGSDKIIAEQETGEKLFPEDVRVFSEESAAAVEESAAVTGFQAMAALRTMTSLLVGAMLFL